MPKKPAIVTYVHHGDIMNVREDLKGHHREYCLCFRCLLFKPGQGNNCPVAQALFEFDKWQGVTTPVWECRRHEDGEPDLSMQSKGNDDYGDKL